MRFIAEMIRGGIKLGTQSDNEAVQGLSNILVGDLDTRWDTCVLQYV